MGEVTLLSVFVRIFLAVFIGGVIGLERGMKNRPAGLRTYMLVCVGSTLIMLTNLYIFQSTGTGDPVRLGAQVVSGIGFLGAGTIVVTKRNHIKGLTTAAGLWASAGVGLALGAGFYEAALITAVCVYAILTVLQKWDNVMRSRSRVMELYVEISSAVSVGVLVNTIRGLNVEVEEVQLDQDSVLEENVRAVLMTLKSAKSTNHQDTIEKISGISGVLFVEEQ